MYIIVAPDNIEEGVSVHVDEDGKDLVVREAVQSGQVLISTRKPAEVTLKKDCLTLILVLKKAG